MRLYRDVAVRRLGRAGHGKATIICPEPTQCSESSKSRRKQRNPTLHRTELVKMLGFTLNISVESLSKD